MQIPTGLRQEISFLKTMIAWFKDQKVQYSMDVPGGSDSKESACNEGDLGSIPRSGRPLEKGMATTSVFLPGELHG